jgi:predicted nucleic acid-binding protein
MIAAPVYLELLAYPRATPSFVDRFLAKTGITVDFDLTEEVWRGAGHAYRLYAERRRQSGAGHSKRLLVDFLIGAHAVLAADRLLTLDADRYRKDFPKLRLM